MLKPQHALIGLALLLAMLGDSWGQSSGASTAKSQQNEAAPQQQKAAKDQRGTEQQPPVVQPLSTKKTTQETASEENEAKKKTNSDWWTWFLSLLTVVALFGQLAVFIAQAYFLKGALNAAKDTLEATTAIEYPIIGTHYIGPELESADSLIGPNIPYATSQVDRWPTKYSVISEIVFHNYGRTPAFVDHLEVGIAVTLLLPLVPHYKHFIRSDPGTMIKERDNSTIETHFGFELSDEQIKSIAERTAILWFFVALIYKDVRGKQREARSCWKWGQQNPASGEGFYFFDDGSAPAAYTAKL